MYLLWAAELTASRHFNSRGKQNSETKRNENEGSTERITSRLCGTVARHLGVSRSMLLNLHLKIELDRMPHYRARRIHPNRDAFAEELAPLTG